MLKKTVANPSRMPRLMTHLLIWTFAILMMINDAEAVQVTGFGELSISSSGHSCAVPALSTAIDLEVSGPLIKAVVRQEFVNPSDQVIEATYVFPLPEGATVFAMELLVGERRIVSVVQEKSQARRTYQKARDSGRRAALVESQRPNLFTTEVANIGPGEKVTVRLEYLDQASYEDGWFGLVVPLTFTPRYFPDDWRQSSADSGMSAPVPGNASAIAEAQRLSPPFVRGDNPDFPEASIDVRLNPGLELADLLSPSHDLSVHQNGALWLAGPERRTVPADRDFILRWRPVSAAMAQPAVFFEDRPEGRYALVMVVPGMQNSPDGPAVETAAAPPTETLFVMDISGSMDGPSLVQAQEALATALGELEPGDQFNIMAFNNQSLFWQGDFQGVSPATLGDARRWVRSLRADGGTALHPALLRAQTAFLASVPGERARRIILLTDAAVGNEDQLLRETIAHLGSIRLHVVGIGMAPNRYLVRRLAGQGGGLSIFVSGHGGDAARLTSFLNRIARPQLVDPHLDWTAGGPQPEGYPARLAAPFSGELTLWSGRFAAGTDLEGFLRARWAGQDLALALSTADGMESAGVAVRWANLKVDDLLAAYDGGGDRNDLRSRIVATGLDFGLVTRFTSRVAVEEIVSSEGPEASHRLANGLPAGSTLLGELPQGGTLAPLWRALGLVLLLTGLAGWRARAIRTTGAKGTTGGRSC